MILLALALQAAAPVSRPAPEPLKAIDTTAAIDLFTAVCWSPFRDPRAFRDALVAAPVPLAAVPAAPGEARAAEIYRADEAILSYLAADGLPAGVPPRQCRLRVRLSGTADQLALAGRVAAALRLPNGRTRTDPAGAETSWNVAQPDGRTVRLLVATRNGARGGTELRLSALLLAER